MVHVAAIWLINQFNPVQQSRKQVPRAYCPIYTAEPTHVTIPIWLIMGERQTDRHIGKYEMDTLRTMEPKSL